MTNEISMRKMLWVRSRFVWVSNNIFKMKKQKQKQKLNDMYKYYKCINKCLSQYVKKNWSVFNALFVVYLSRSWVRVLPAEAVW